MHCLPQLAWPYWRNAVVCIGTCKALRSCFTIAKRFAVYLTCWIAKLSKWAIEDRFVLMGRKIIQRTTSRASVHFPLARQNEGLSLLGARSVEP